jgi:hypothetical protein
MRLHPRAADAAEQEIAEPGQCDDSIGFPI